MTSTVPQPLLREQLLVASPHTAMGAARGSKALLDLTAAVIPIMLAFDKPLPHNLTTAMIASFFLAPVWITSFVQTSHGAIYTLGFLAFLTSGLMLDWVSSSDHDVPRRLVTIGVLTFGRNLLAVGALFWSSKAIGVSRMLLFYGIGWLLDTLATSDSWRDNPWKFGFAVPVSLLIFTMIDRQRFTTIKLIAALTLGLYSLLNDSRSIMAVFLLTGLALVWQRIRSTDIREPRIALFLAGGTIIAGISYYLLTRLLVSGLVGPELQARSQRQVELSGSLLLGGRPEWTVTIRLFNERIWGFGFGTQPSPGDYELGRQGFASIHLLSQENYLKHFVFNDSFSLHSIVADMWSAGGLVGIIFVVMMIWMLLSSLAFEFAHRNASAAQIFLTMLAMWNIGFSPYYSNLHEVALAVAVAIAARSGYSVAVSQRAPSPVLRKFPPTDLIRARLRGLGDGQSGPRSSGRQSAQVGDEERPTASVAVYPKE